MERIAALKDALQVNWAELGRLSGRSRQAVNNWRQGGVVSGEAALSLQSKANVNPEWLLYGKGSMFLEKPIAIQMIDDLLISLSEDEQERALAILRAAFDTHTE